MSVYSIIKKPIVTEKTQRLELQGTYTMLVDPRATKVDIRKSFERLYGVTVESVNTVRIREKFHATKRGILPKRKLATKALVTLAKGQKINDLLKVKE
jgi:large subunit ribosomal protein L23